MPVRRMVRLGSLILSRSGRRAAFGPFCYRRGRNGTAHMLLAIIEVVARKGVHPCCQTGLSWCSDLNNRGHWDRSFLLLIAFAGRTSTISVSNSSYWCFLWSYFQTGHGIWYDSCSLFDSSFPWYVPFPHDIEPMAYASLPYTDSQHQLASLTSVHRQAPPPAT